MNKLELFEQLPNDAMQEITVEQLEAELGGKSFSPEQPQPKPQPQPIEQAQTQTQTQPFLNGPSQKVNLASILTGETPVRLLNSIAPPLLSIGLRLATNRDIPKQHFSLSAEERKTVEPVLNNALAHLNINFENPFVAIAVSLGAVYGGKILNVVSDLEKFDLIQQNEEKENKRPVAAVKKDGRGRPRKQPIENN